MNTSKFLQRIKGKVRSRKPGQPGQPGSYEEAIRGPVVPLVCGFIRRDNLQSWCELIRNLYKRKSGVSVGPKSWVVGSKSWVVGPKSWVVEGICILTQQTATFIHQ